MQQQVVLGIAFKGRLQVDGLSAGAHPFGSRFEAGQLRFLEESAAGDVAAFDDQVTHPHLVKIAEGAGLAHRTGDSDRGGIFHLLAGENPHFVVGAQLDVILRVAGQCTGQVDRHLFRGVQRRRQAQDFSRPGIIIGEQIVIAHQQLGQAHPLVQLIKAWAGDKPFKPHVAVFRGRDGMDLHQVAILHGELEGIDVEPGGIKVKINNLAPLMSKNALDLDFFEVGGGLQTACHLEQVAQRFAFPEFVNGGAAHISGDTDLRGRDRHMNSVAGTKAQILLAIARHEEIVEINMGHCLPPPHQLHVAQAAVAAGAAGLCQGIENGGHGTDRVSSRIFNFPDEENLDGAQAAHGDVDFKVTEIFRHLPPQCFARFGKGLPPQVDGTDARQSQADAAVNSHLVVPLNAPPQVDDQSVAGADYVIGTDRRHAVRQKGSVIRLEKIEAELLQIAINVAALEISEYLFSTLLFLLLQRVGERCRARPADAS